MAIALGSDCGDTPTKSRSSVCSSNPMKSNQKDKISMSKMESSNKKMERETLAAIHNETLHEIIAKLLDRPEKIFIIARMIDNEQYFKKRAVLSEDGLHVTIVKIRGVPEHEMTIVLPEKKHAVRCCTLNGQRMCSTSQNVLIKEYFIVRVQENCTITNNWCMYARLKGQRVPPANPQVHGRFGQNTQTFMKESIHTCSSG